MKMGKILAHTPRFCAKNFITGVVTVGRGGSNLNLAMNFRHQRHGRF